MLRYRKFYNFLAIGATVQQVLRFWNFTIFSGAVIATVTQLLHFWSFAIFQSPLGASGLGATSGFDLCLYRICGGTTQVRGI